MPLSSTNGNQKNAEASALRDRLRSESRSREHLFPPPGLLRLFEDHQAKYDLDSTRNFFTAMKSFVDSKDDRITCQLKNASTKTSTELHDIILHELRQTRDDIDTAIEDSSKATSSVLSRTQALYSNIEHPLSATLCHSSSLPRATISAHCETLCKEIASRIECVDQLKQEWTKCCQNEEKLWEEFEDFMLPQDKKNSDGGELSTALAALECEVRNIVETTEEEIDGIEAEFRDAIKAETFKMVSLMV
ncbi:hypothetical protein NLU13_5811 [Sarocladium strictum]|uniref:Uncharacterized protein n=1 Tax=Sarocladium strictum TaxID=5046 RepID=A0AA39L8B1_SARSR|nr:hypothetical protein NLU13_5811 [Sarocladium strictum]